jgi:hypothetical protein
VPLTLVLLPVAPLPIAPQSVVALKAGRNTDKKEKKIFLIYKEIQSGAVAKLYMTT